MRMNSIHDIFIPFPYDWSWWKNGGWFRNFKQVSVCGL